MSRFYRVIGKRSLDLAMAMGGLVLFAIPMLWFYDRLRREFDLDPFFLQTRMGKGGRNFTILKFRTMSEEETIPPFCRWLRKTAMDELPQMINIVRGEMSFVGPRPLILEELENLGKMKGGKLRQSVRPGLTGLAQLYSIKTPGLPERLRWDLTYVKKCSLGLDLWIILRSVAVTLQGAWEGKEPHLNPSAAKGKAAC